MNTQDLLEMLNDEQKDAVVHKEGPLMIVAGAGTGKTMVVTRRIAWLIDQGLVKPEQILALTFTDKAAAEMEERVDLLLPYGYVDLQISTFHSFCERLLREFGVEIGLPTDFRLANELDAWLLARQNFDRFELDHYRPLGNPTKYIRSMLTHFSRLKDMGHDPDAYLSFVEEQRADLDSSQASEEVTAELARLDELARAYQTYQTILLENDSLDFGDLILYTIQLLAKRPGVLAEVRRRYPYVLVDEFQDTNDAQYRLVKAIASPKNNITVVGDDDQSIYKFRGASLANILRFETDYPDTKKIVLTNNYRSVQEILDHAHGFIQNNNPNRLEASSEGKLSKKLKAHREGKGVIEHIHADRLEDEVRMVAEKILDLKEVDQELVWNDFAVLVRSNSAGTDFSQTLERYKIPYQFLALRGLYTKPVVLDVMSLMRVINDPYESSSMYRVLLMEKFEIDETTIIELNHLARRKGKSLFEAIELSMSLLELDPEQARTLTSLTEQIRGYQVEARKKNVSELFVKVIKESGYLEWLNGLGEREKLESFGYLQQMYQRLKSFERRHEHPVLHHFLEEFAHERDAGEEGSLNIDLDAGPDMVRIMTVHAAKGLEFKHVFVVNLVDQRFPTRRQSDAIPVPEGLAGPSDDSQDHVEEERRLFYVAMTRAKDGLYLTSASDYGGVRKRKLSRFLHELGYEIGEDGQSVKELEIFDEDKGLGEVDDDVKIPIPKQFSFTQLAAFKTCPLQYKFAHVLKVPVFGKWTFSFGKTMHNTLQRFFTVWLERTGQQQASLFDSGQEDIGEVPVSLDELMEMYTTCWQDEWYVNDEQREEYRAKGRKSLRTFYKGLDENMPKPLSIEQGFTLKFGDVILKGRIDRMDVFEDGVEIIDYKTGTPKPEKKMTKQDKEQLYLYQMAARDVLGLNPKKLTFHYLEDNSQVSFLASDDDLIKLQEAIVDRVQHIRESSFQATPGFSCKFCDFADICEFRQT